MPVSGEPVTSPFIDPPAQVVMLFPVKSSVQGKVPPFVPGTVQMLFHVPPRSPKPEAAEAIFVVVKLNQGPVGEACWQEPSISVALTASVHVTAGLPPVGPACIVQAPLRSNGTRPALKVP